jgi:hypothetical protein
VRAMARRRIAPPEATIDDEDDAVEDATVIHPRNAVRARKVWADTPDLGRGEPERDGHDGTSAHQNHHRPCRGKQTNRS